MNGQMKPTGTLTRRIVRAEKLKKDFNFAEVLRFGYPQKGLSKLVNEWRERNWFENLLSPALRLKAMATLNGLLRSGEVRAFGQLHLTNIRANGEREVLGLASLRVVTDAGVAFLRDVFAASNDATLMKFHGIGTGTGSEAAGDTALGTELTTQLNPDNVRATGTRTTNGANVYRSVGTNTVDSAVAITEHGILSSATVGAGTLWDRSKFTADNLGSGDSIQTTYDLTLPSGS